MDLLYLVKKTQTNEELRYSFRSLSNIKHDKVIIVGDLPDWVNTEIVYYIPTEKLSNRYETTTNNIKLACQNKELSDDFILMNDDFFFIEPTTIQDLNKNRGLLQDTVKFYHKTRKLLTNYDKNVEKACNELKGLGFNNPISFELHTPMIINKQNFLSIVDKLNNDALHCCKRSVYGNYFIKDSTAIDDVKVLSFKPLDLVLKAKPKVISVSRCCLEQITPFLQNKFPSKSIYEK